MSTLAYMSEETWLPVVDGPSGAGGKTRRGTRLRLSTRRCAAQACLRHIAQIVLFDERVSTCANNKELANHPCFLRVKMDTMNLVQIVVLFRSLEGRFSAALRSWSCSWGQSRQSGGGRGRRRARTTRGRRRQRKSPPRSPTRGTQSRTGQTSGASCYAQSDTKRGEVCAGILAPILQAASHVPHVPFFSPFTCIRRGGKSKNRGKHIHSVKLCPTFKITRQRLHGEAESLRWIYLRRETLNPDPDPTQYGR